MRSEWSLEGAEDSEVEKKEINHAASPLAITRGQMIKGERSQNRRCTAGRSPSLVCGTSETACALILKKYSEASDKLCGAWLFGTALRGLQLDVRIAQTVEGGRCQGVLQKRRRFLGRSQLRLVRSERKLVV